MTLAAPDPGLYPLHRLDEFLPAAVVADLQRSATRRGVSATETLRRGVAVLAFLTDEVANGNKPAIVVRRRFHRSRIRGLDLTAKAHEIANSHGGGPEHRLAVWLADDTHHVLLRLERRYQLDRSQTAALAIEVLRETENAVAGGNKFGNAETGHRGAVWIRELIFVDAPSDRRPRAWNPLRDATMRGREP